MFRRRIHLPLGVIEAHVAGLAGLRLPCLLDRKQVPCVTRVAGRHPKAAALLLQLPDLHFSLEANLVAPTTALHPFGESHRLPVKRGHGFHGSPTESMFSRLELFDLCWMAGLAGFGRGDQSLFSIGPRGVLLAMTHRTLNAVFAVLAKLPVRDDAGSHVLVAVDATLIRAGRQAPKEEDQR